MSPWSRPALRLARSLVLVIASLGVLSAAQAQAADCSGVSEINNTGLKGVLVVDDGFTGSPLLVIEPPDGSRRLFIVTKQGRIYIKTKGAPATGPHTLYLDISAQIDTTSEGGLLGLAFDPDFATTKHFWVYYTESIGLDFFSVVSRFTEDPDGLGAGAEQRVLRFEQPEENHNGGQVFFDRNGYLLVATGDGGGGGDIHGLCGNGQNVSNLLGKILRIDVREVAAEWVDPDCSVGASAYRIPNDNPFVDAGIGPCDEILSYGLRNPWRNEQDPETGELYLADVGQTCSEEINVTPESRLLEGINYGWRQMEGFHCYSNFTPDCDPAGVACSGSPDCNDPSLELPFFEYSHSQGCSITGGHVYRGCRMPDLRGRYFYGDYCEGFVKSLRADQDPELFPPLDHTLAIDPDGFLVGALYSFGRDRQGELYVISGFGQIFKILPLFTDLIVSAPGAGTPFLLGADWTWEDLEDATDHPVASYRVYRSADPASEPFRCVHATADDTPAWTGGDSAVPDPGTQFAYLVRALSPDGEESASGHPAVAVIPGLCP